MLRSLHVRDLAIIERVDVDFGPGFTVVTGETGAGKSILLDALLLALGRRADPDQVRSGADEAVAEVSFDDVPDQVWAALSAGDVVAPAGDRLTIRRIVAAGGRSRAYVNDVQVGVALLRDIAPLLLRIYGQDDDQALRRVESHLDLVDAAGGLGSAVGEMRRRFGRLVEARGALATWRERQEQAQERVEFLRYQLGEIDAAALRAGEEVELEREHARLANAERLVESVSHAERLVYSADGAAVAVLGKSLGELRAAAKLDAELDAVAAQLQSALHEIEDVGAALARYANHLVADPGRLAEVDERRMLIRRLTKKYGGDVAGVLARRAAIAAELEPIAEGDDRVEALSAEVAAAERAALAWAKRLAVARRRVARQLERELTRELRALALDGARFEVRFTDVEESVGPTGRDEIEFYLATNPGEEIRPLVKVASGGERSRVMLALKAVSPRDEQHASLVFDEVDSGVGGAVGEVIGRKLAQLGQRRQVLAVTHLPVVAAFGDQHVAIGKRQVGGRTVSTAVGLSATERVAELARMLGGARVTPEVREHAQQLLQQGTAARGMS